MNNKEIIRQYVEGWKEGDPIKIMSVLADDCEIIESHGPIYRGLEMAEEWVSSWIKTGKVTKWEIKSFIESGESIVFEWEFAFMSGNESHEILGISVAKVASGKIKELREYRLTQKPFLAGVK